MKDYTLSKENIAELEKFHRSLRDKRHAPWLASKVRSRRTICHCSSRCCWCWEWRVGGFFLVFLAVWVNFGLGLTI
jgi:hypothetical protein